MPTGSLRQGGCPRTTTRRGLLSDLAYELRAPLASLDAYHGVVIDGIVQPSDETWDDPAGLDLPLQRLVEDLAVVSPPRKGRLD